ncbi:MAG: OmpA family protein [Bacteroidia bacterium]|nr:OmpA family protein [Bacteroidia bacterium]NND10385.1 OmpA family protein [Flavobacteriaceae bacterium]MBT8308982.1 OmpA family protein [Bacteroidia bacterium]NNK27937.1 OmpA family protein [Flavobacteriaceae bacterium]NNL60809.1 OmpA family protein [Flavobacteriaceae bacterium]
MKRLVYLLLLSANMLFSQEEFKHVVYFDTDQYVVPSTEKNRILLFIQELSGVDIDKIEIFGFCDDRGTDNYNQILSQQRADAIKSIFTENSVDQSKITNVDGRGEILLNIVHEDDLNEIRGLNRKVEIIVKPEPKVVEVVKVKAKKDDRLIKDDVKVGDKILLKNILFKVNYSYIEPESKKVLEKIAKELVKRDDIHFIVQGHVCCTENSRDAIDRKTRKRNLSVARAKYIYDYLARKGVSKSRMKYVGLRRKFPLGKGEKNDRRVEIMVTHIADRN